MKKSAILIITALATAAFFAHSPEAERLVTNAWSNLIGHGSPRPQKLEADGADAGATLSRDSESLLQPGDTADLRLPMSSLASEQRETGIIDPEIEADKLAQVAGKVPYDGLRYALDSALHDHGEFASQLRELLIRRWAEIDPVAAASWVSGLQDPSIAASLAQQIATVWANKDLAASVDWAGALPNGAIRQAAVLGLGYEAARNNSFEAFDLVAALPPSSERDSLLVHIARQWAVSDPSEAAIWANRVPNTTLRERLISAVAITSAMEDPSGAASLIATNLTPGRTQDQAAVAIVQRWAQTNAEGAASWINLFPNPATRSAAQEALAQVQPTVPQSQPN